MDKVPAYIIIHTNNIIDLHIHKTACDIDEYRDGEWWQAEHVKNRALRGYIPANYVVEVKELNSFKTFE